ncbi:MAG: sulfatase [Bdellovibrionota bacterium]
MIKKTLYIFSIILACLLFTFIAQYIIIVYPNDYRIDVTAIPKDSVLKEKKNKAEIYPGIWPQFTHNIDLKKYKEKIRTVDDISAHIIQAIPGGPSPLYANYSIGNYPEYVENRKGILLANGKNIKINADLNGTYELELGAAAVVSDSDLEVSIAGKLIDKLSLKRPPDPINQDTFFQKFIGKYWKLTTDDNYKVWVDKLYTITFKPNESITLTCKSKNGYCFISRPKIYKEATTPKNNYLFILVDTLKYDAIDSETTPTLDKFRNSGIEFTNAMSVGNMTTPSCYGLLSCQKPSRLPDIAFAYGASQFKRRKFYQKNEDSFPRFFQKGGWKTAMIGNISVISEALGIGVDHGFDQHVAIERDAYDTPKITNEASIWLKNNRDQPFFLYVHYHAPHAPYRAPLKDIFTSYKSISELSSLGSIFHWLYRSEVTYTDRYIKILLENLKNLGLSDNTNIIITADHGEFQQMKTFQDNDAGNALTGTFFDHGATLYNDELHIPLFFKGPDFNKTKKINNFVSNLDIAPTLLDSIGESIPDRCDGITLLPAIQSESLNVSFKDRIIGSEGMRRRAIIFENRYKYILSYSMTNKLLFTFDSYLRKKFSVFQKELLFDLKNDPRETTNIIDLDERLTSTAREKMKEFYETTYLWELVIESPEESPIIIEFNDKVSIPIKYEGIAVLDLKKMNTYLMQRTKRATMTFANQPEQLPNIFSAVNNKFMNIPIRKTYAKLNIHSNSDKLPAEAIGASSLMPIENKINAYLRKVEKIDFQEIRPVAGNKKFEKVLRDWGYLNDK